MPGLLLIIVEYFLRFKDSAVVQVREIHTVCIFLRFLHDLRMDRYFTLREHRCLFQIVIPVFQYPALPVPGSAVSCPGSFYQDFANAIMIQIPAGNMHLIRTRIKRKFVIQKAIWFLLIHININIAAAIAVIRILMDHRRHVPLSIAVKITCQERGQLSCPTLKHFIFTEDLKTLLRLRLR